MTIVSQDLAGQFNRIQEVILKHIAFAINIFCLEVLKSP